MGTVNGKAAIPGDEEVFPLDGPWIWSHMPRGYAADEESDFLHLPPPKILSDYTFDVPMVKQGTELGRPEIVEIVPKEASPKPQQHPAHATGPPAAHEAAPAVPEAQEAPVLQELHGRKKSLLIGINYFGSAHELHGCVDDVNRMMPLVEKWGFAQEGCCKVLLDSPGAQPPSRRNIQQAIAWLVDGAAAGDALFFHYSGHGGRVPRTDGRGEWHETLCPADMDEAGMIHDNELFEMLVKPLPKGCRLTCILDACHSAGALDLPFIFTGTPENIKKAMAGEAVQMALSKNWVRDFERWSVEEDPMALLGDVASVGFGLWDMWRQYKAKTEANQDGFCPDEPGNIGMTSAEVVAITGCASDQTSADVGDVHSQFDLKDTHAGQLRLGRPCGESGGALTCAFVEAMDGIEGCSILDLLEHLRERLASGGFSQVPQLASSLVLDLKQPWSLSTVIGHSTGNNISSTCRSGGTAGGLMGGIGNGLSNALAGGALGGNCMGNPMANPLGGAYPSPGMVGDGGLLGALSGWGGSSWFGSHTHPAPEVAEEMSEEEEDYGDEMLDDDFEDDFEEEYSDED